MIMIIIMAIVIVSDTGNEGEGDWRVVVCFVSVEVWLDERCKVVSVSTIRVADVKVDVDFPEMWADLELRFAFFVVRLTESSVM